jgi:hypothetical protein
VRRFAARHLTLLSTGSGNDARARSGKAGWRAEAASVAPKRGRGQSSHRARTTGFPLRGLILLFPLLRGPVYWLRYPSLMVSEKITRFDFTAALGPGLDCLARFLLAALTYVVAPVLVLMLHDLGLAGMEELVIEPESGWTLDVFGGRSATPAPGQ